MHYKTQRLVLLVLMACVVALTAVAAGGRTALFNGKNLSGWTVRKCQASVENGEILLSGGNGLVQTEKKYADFLLEFECKALGDDNWDSGVYFRYDSVPEDAAWPSRYQVNLRKGLEGNVQGLDGAASEGLFKAGQWNRFALTVKGSTISLQINGQNAWKAEGLEGPSRGFIGLQAEVPNGGQYRFRNVYITEL